LALALTSPQRYWGPHPKATSEKGQLWAALALGPTARPPGEAGCPWGPVPPGAFLSKVNPT